MAATVLSGVNCLVYLCRRQLSVREPFDPCRDWSAINNLPVMSRRFVNREMIGRHFAENGDVPVVAAAKPDHGQR